MRKPNEQFDFKRRYILLAFLIFVAFCFFPELLPLVIEIMWIFLKEHWPFIIFIVFSFIHVTSFVSRKNEMDEKRKTAGETRISANNLEANKFASNSITASSVAGVTAVSILIPASFVIVQIAKQKDAPQLPPEAMSYVFTATVYFLGSLFCGLFLIFLVPLHGQARNLAEQTITGIPFGIQLIALVVGICCLVVGLSYVVG